MSLAAVSPDEYASWKDSDVTKRFLAEIAIQLQEAKEERIIGTHEQMIKMAHARNEAMDILESVLTWKPSELEAEE